MNHFSDKPMIPRPPELKSNEPVVSKDWRLALEEKEIAELYVDYFFWKEGIGSKLVEFAKEKFDSKFVWTLEKNEDAIRFYEAHGFKLNGKRQLEEGTPEYIVMLERD